MSLTERIKYAEMKARHAKSLRPWYKKWWGVLIIVSLAIIGIILVFSGFYVANKVKEIRLTQAQSYINEQRQAYLQAVKGDGSNYSFGAASPQITIIEFSDFACPFCAQSAVGLRAVGQEYKDRLKIVFRDYPLHDNSIDLSLAARCAGAQGKFWEFYDYLFAHQSELTGSSTELQIKLLMIAQEQKLDTDKFSTCLNNKTYLEQIKNDYQDGETLELQGTPTWFINNYRLTGALTEEKIRELVAGLIK